ncbi:MAG: ComEC/Rec2 family competence protein, partial [Cytophagales bacterium]|nr:ComEC/Rec2 family competence protein [Cytophaga sp.]
AAMEMLTRKHVPMLRYAIYMMAGIVIAQYTAITSFVFILFLSVCICYLIYRIYKPVAYHQIYLAVCIASIAVVLGILRHTVWLRGNTETHKEVRSLRISNVPQHSYKSIRFEAEEVSSSFFHFFDAKRYIVSCRDTNAVLAFGDVLSVHAQPERIPAAELPFQFNYASYAFSRGITQRITLCSVEKICDSSSYAFFYAWINHSRTHFKEATAAIFISTAAKGLAESLLLGYKEDLDASTKDAFQKSGVSHLLAVSGMHTALIYEGIFLLFLPFGTSQKHRIVFLITALFVLCYFTVLSGCSASVVRSSLMCGTFAIGYAFRKKGSGLNTLGTSMLIILWLSPYQLWDLGFQLSVLAVFGILTLHASLSKRFEHQHALPKYLLNALSITICAQVMTLPVILYHFHSFPVYFIAANLLLIPISTAAMFMTMFSIGIFGIGIHIPFVFQCTQWLIELFERCAMFFAALPHSIIHPVSFSAVEYLLCALLIACFLFFHTQKKIYYLSITIMCIGWSVYRLTEEYRSMSRTEEIFISNGKKSGLLLMEGLRAEWYGQQECNPRDLLQMQQYFNIPYIHTTILPSAYKGMVWHSGQRSEAWMYAKIKLAPEYTADHLFSYKVADTISFHASKHVPLNVKSMLYLK